LADPFVAPTSFPGALAATDPSRSSPGGDAASSIGDLAGKATATASTLFREGRAFLASNEEVSRAAEDLSHSVRRSLWPPSASPLPPDSFSHFWSKLDAMETSLIGFVAMPRPSSEDRT
jgi:hypothetical protein